MYLCSPHRPPVSLLRSSMGEISGIITAKTSHTLPTSIYRQTMLATWLQGLTNMSTHIKMINIDSTNQTKKLWQLQTSDCIQHLTIFTLCNSLFQLVSFVKNRNIQIIKFSATFHFYVQKIHFKKTYQITFQKFPKHFWFINTLHCINVIIKFGIIYPPVRPSVHQSIQAIQHPSQACNQFTNQWTQNIHFQNQTCM